MRILLTSLLLAAGLALPATASAERVKDLASVAGVRNNQLVGYGIVVGLDGTGDQTTQTPFTVQSFTAMLQQLGVNLPTGTTLQLKNVAAVTVTASLPAFAQPGQTIDLTVSSIGNAKSLRGGTLLLAPLKGADGQIYAMAQGNVLVGGVGAAAPGATAVVNHLNVGKVPAGATVERAVASNVAPDNMVRLELLSTDFGMAAKLADTINDKFGADVATALDGRVVRVRAPSGSQQRVTFLGMLENLDVPRENGLPAKIIMNARTGSVVMNKEVRLDECAISHGNLSVNVSTDTTVVQGGAFNPTVVANNSSIEIKKDPGKIVSLNKGANLSEVVKALNAIGASPQDLLSILQAMKAAGSLRAELEII